MDTKLQKIADTIDAHSNSYLAYVIKNRIRIVNISDPNWHGKTEEYARAFAKTYNMVLDDIDWHNGGIWIK